MEGIVERLCENCIFFAKDTFECRRFPPKSLAARDWPIVERYDWCGEFKDKWQVRVERGDP